MSTTTKYRRRASSASDQRDEQRLKELDYLSRKAKSATEWELYAQWNPITTFDFTEQMWRAVGAHMFTEWLEGEDATEEDRRLVRDINAWLSTDHG